MFPLSLKLVKTFLALNQMPTFENHLRIVGFAIKAFQPISWISRYSQPLKVVCIINDLFWSIPQPISYFFIDFFSKDFSSRKHEVQAQATNQSRKDNKHIFESFLVVKVFHDITELMS